MKAVFLFTVLIGVVYGEFCATNSTTDCHLEVCTTPLVPTCITTICTCAAKPESSCQTASDCDATYWTNHHCSQPHRSCVNNKCDCVHGHGHQG